MARVVGATNLELVELGHGWEITEVPAGGAAVPESPEQLGASARSFFPGEVPGTVASALRALGRWDFGSTKNFDASDWWYRTRFEAAAPGPFETVRLCFDGLATLAEVWLNGKLILRSNSMFERHVVDVTELLSEKNEIWLRFPSLEVALGQRKPRPRFRTRLVERQQLRWFRTTLLGRIPGWTPPVVPVGPFRSIRLERTVGACVLRVRVQPRLVGTDGLLRVAVNGAARGAVPPKAFLVVRDRSVELSAAPSAPSSFGFTGELSIEAPELWWPHTHGEQPRYPVELVLEGPGEPIRVALDPVSFRKIRAGTEHGAFTLSVNDVEIFCRGACWTTDDIVSLGGEAQPSALLRLVREAGMNMLRVGGTMIYENDAFYEACDALGILVWQDFMFANLDYPGDDPEFLTSVTREATQFLDRTDARACVAVLCGNSEIEQQAAMLGLPRAVWTQPWFDRVLQDLVLASRDGAVYVTSTPTGGPLPFSVDVGVSHYYGVGAYQRPLEDARRAGVRFTTECLAFANIPEAATLERFLDDGQAPFHHPRWKARVPRDSGTGWDFDDVRDHYTQLLFGVDPAAVRYADADEALYLGRIASGEVIARTLTEWRRGASACRGALLWFLKDLWPGVGWGIIDSTGRPKAAYYFAKRALLPVSVGVTDEGLNGLGVHLFNDTASAMTVNLAVDLLREGNVSVGRATKDGLVVPPHSALELRSAELFEHFLDVTHAYRFGPPAHDVSSIVLTDATSGERLSDAFHFPRGLSARPAQDTGLKAQARPTGDGAWELTLSSERFAPFVAFDCGDFVPDDAYFHLSPGVPRRVLFRSPVPGARFQGSVRVLGGRANVRIQL